MTKIGIIVGSIREGRVGLRVAKWVANAVAQRSAVQLLDLRDYPLPLFDEAASPRFNPNRTPTPEVQRWLLAVAACDGFVLVSPEYNGSMPGVLKNAIDCIGTELEDKPCAIVTYGARGGSQATVAIRAACRWLAGYSLKEPCT